MCGIAGILHRHALADTEDERRLTAAMERLRHRGPDHIGVYADGPLRMAHRRLSILDLTPAGNQPMRSASGRFVIAINGEIYNFIELRAQLEREGHSFHTGTDTEVLLAAFEQWGIGCLAMTRGMFALALWDTATRTLLLARDRLGEKPIFFQHTPERLAFASELKGLLPLLINRPQLSAQAINDFLHYQYALEPGTPLQGVYKIPAGHYLVIGETIWDMAEEPYWNLFDAAPRTDDPVLGLRDALDSAVELTLRSDAPVGIGLSAGIDSGLIAALAARRRGDLTAFTVGYPGAYAFDERDGARQLAERLRIPWKSVELSSSEFAAFFPRLVASIDEPIADVAAYAHYAVAKLAADHGIKVLLTGIGGDELFFGYGWVREALRLSRMKLDPNQHDSPQWTTDLLQAVVERPLLLHVIANRRFPAWWQAAVHRAFDKGRLDLAHADEWVFYQLDYHWTPAARFTREVFSKRFSALPERNAHRLMCGLNAHRGDPQLGICKLLFDSWLISNCLALGDRVSMANSVETRMPLLDAALVEAVVGYLKAGRSDAADGHKVWLRTIAADVLPADVLNRPKTGFMTPAVEWMSAVNERYRPQLVDGTLIAEGVLDPDRLRRWIATTPAGIHRDFFLYKLTLLEIWNREIVTSSAAVTGATRLDLEGFGRASR